MEIWLNFLKTGDVPPYAIINESVFSRNICNSAKRIKAFDSSNVIDHFNKVSTQAIIPQTLTVPDHSIFLILLMTVFEMSKPLSFFFSFKFRSTDVNRGRLGTTRLPHQAYAHMYPEELLPTNQITSLARKLNFAA